jgi:hypothetical protein
MTAARSRLVAVLFGCMSVGVVGAAAGFAWEFTHASLGTLGGVLSAIVAGLLAAGPFFIVWAAIWGPQDVPDPRLRAPRVDGEVAGTGARLQVDDVERSPGGRR